MKTKFLFVTIRRRNISWQTDTDISGSDPYEKLSEVETIIYNLKKRFNLANKDIEIRNERNANPVPKLGGGKTMDAARKAARLYQNFSGHFGEFEVHKLKIRELPKAVAVFGVLDSIEYTTVRDGKTELYRHEFKLAKSRKPLFCVSPDGQQIFIIGGDYRVTDRGIEDA